MKIAIHSVILLVCLALILTGCAATVHYESEPAGATVYVDKEFRGPTPGTYFDWVPSRMDFAMKGYGPAFSVDRPGGGILWTSNPPGAILFYDGMEIGVMPLRYSPPGPPSVIKFTWPAVSYATENMDVTLAAKPARPTAFSRRWAVVIGVSNYQDTRIPSLRYASTDAQAFYDWAVSPSGGKYAPSRVKLLVNKQATCKNIKDALFVWLKQALAEDTVTIYFAGHGSPESPDSPKNLFLLPCDTQYDSIATTGFPMWDVETALKRYIKAKKVVVIADACHSGGVGQSFDIARRTNRGLKVNPISSGIQNLSQVGDGVCVISASDEKQYSQESKDWGGGHGVFTYFLLKGLKGNADYNKDASVTLGELTSYLSQEVRRATKNAQSPTVAGRYDPALTIGK